MDKLIKFDNFKRVIKSVIARLKSGIVTDSVDTDNIRTNYLSTKYITGNNDLLLTIGKTTNADGTLKIISKTLNTDSNDDFIFNSKIKGIGTYNSEDSESIDVFNDIASLKNKINFMESSHGLTCSLGEDVVIGDQHQIREFSIESVFKTSNSVNNSNLFVPYDVERITNYLKNPGKSINMTLKCDNILKSPVGYGFLDQDTSIYIVKNRSGYIDGSSTDGYHFIQDNWLFKITDSAYIERNPNQPTSQTPYWKFNLEVS